MSFQVNPSDIRAYAAKLLTSYDDVSDAKTYAHANGDFSFHQTGIIGLLAGGHHRLMDDLDAMLGHLQVVLSKSNEALISTAATYESTDQQAAARVDATYPETVRPAATVD
ncbi:hypothetical protein ACFQS1_31710 [Paractinoplanes rhizophilus]|uniref:Excreted virulence factor EspC (Type VII ESX diderm) n=1 Tax=Paractinoplanes rhizophilus TaxID=1416877 RepID=A0ABW2I031_9ACTN